MKKFLFGLFAIFGVAISLNLAKDVFVKDLVDINISLFNVGNAPVELLEVNFGGKGGLTHRHLSGLSKYNHTAMQPSETDPTLTYELLGIHMEHRFKLPTGVARSAATGKALAFWIDSDCGTAEIRWQSSVEVTDEAYRFGKDAPRCDALETVKRLTRERQAKTPAEKPE
jgi:hypothetical protein